MTELEDYTTDYFEFDTQSLQKVTAFFEKESLAKGNFYIKRRQPC